MRYLLFLILSVLFFSVNAEEKIPLISPQLYKKLQHTESLISKQAYSQAERNLTVLLTDVDQGSYEQATVLRSLSSVYALKNQYKKAAESLSRCVNLNVLPETQKQQAIVNLGQLYMATENYSKAIKTLTPWLASHPHRDNQLNALVANAYTQLKNYRNALPYIEKAISGSKKPDSSWYQLNLALYFELNNYNSAARLLKKLITLHPDKKIYWHQLSSVYQQLKDYKKAVSVKYLAYKQGFINTEKGILDLVNLLFYIHSPYQAALLLQNEINYKKIKSNSKNWELLATAWRMSKEFDQAVKALEMASKLHQKGRLYQQLGQIYVEQEKWQLAITALNKAFTKGNLKDNGATYLLLGMSYYEMNNIRQAKQSFLKASNYRQHKKVALQWLGFMGIEK